MHVRFAALLALWLLPSAAAAQLTRATSTVDLPGYGLTTHDGPETLTLNPANMAFMPSWGVSFVHADADGTGQRFGAGDGFYAASPILFGIAAGLAVDSVRPTTGDSARTMVSLALAWQTHDALALGAALRIGASEDARFDGLTTLDLSAAWRPVDWLAMTFLARDIVGPGTGPGEPAVPRSFLLGAGFRPLSDRTLQLDLAGALDERGRIGARLAAEVQVPYAGRVLAAAEAEGLDGGDPDVRVTAGLALDWGMLGVGGGLTVGDGLEDAQGWYVTGRVEGAARPGLPTGDVIANITLGGTGARGILGVVRRMERALHDDRVRGVLLRPRGSGIGLAYAQEIRMMVRRLREAGKPVVCHLDDAAGSEWYACAGADRILVDPAGGVRLTGVSTELFHLGDLLRNVGVRADFVRIGRWKSAIEDYMNHAVSGPAAEQRMGVLDWSYRRLLHDASQDRGISPADMEAVVDLGPHLPEDVVERGLAHALADERDMDAQLRDVFGGGYALEASEPWRAPDRWGHRPRIGVVVVDGTIVDGENLDIPLIGIHASGGRTVSRAIDQLAADPSVRAIVVRVDTGGGSVMASDQIYRAIRRARRRKPVIASLGAVAASGGYYVASACDSIWADPSTVTGSIGVWFGKVDFAPLGRMIGVELEQVGRGRHSGATSFYRPFTAEERSVLAHNVRRWYRAFLRRVARGRGMRVQEVDALARGRLWMGDQAIDNGLVDHLGGFGSALVAARRAAGVGPEVGVSIVPNRPATLLDYVLGFLGIGAAGVDPVAAESQAAALERVAPELRAALSAVVTLRHLGSGAAMAMMPEVIQPR